MPRSRIATFALIGVVLATLLMASGCKEKVARVVSAWPVADSERAVPEPPVPPRWPLTGKGAPSQKAIKKRPLSVKVENSASARPQLGLNSADVIYESVTEGGITRFNCIFQSKVPQTVGPVRSARLSDLWVVPQYKGLFFFSGASRPINAAVNRAKLPNLSQDIGVSAPYSRASNRTTPHNLMLDTAKAYAEAKKRKYAITATVKPLQFDRASRSETVTVSEIAIPFSTANRVRWVYDRKSKSYLRFSNGVAHRDAANNKQVSSTNVVVIWAKHKPVSRDKVGSTTYDIMLGGKGRVTVFHNGQRFDGTWVADRTSPPRFKDKNGLPIKLALGRTWFQIIPLDGRLTMK